MCHRCLTVFSIICALLCAAGNAKSGDRSSQYHKAAPSTHSTESPIGQVSSLPVVDVTETLRPRTGRSSIQPVALSGIEEDSQETSAQDSGSGNEWEKRLRSLEDDWGEYQAGLKDKSAAAKSKPTIEIGGRIHLDYWAFPSSSPGIGFFEHPAPADPKFGTDPEDRFAFRRIRVEMKGDALETMFWRLQFDLGEPDTAVIKDVYIGFRELPGNQQLFIGHQKRPLGLDHLNSSRFNVFIERPFIIETFNEDARRLGIRMQGNSSDEQIHWEYGSYLLENLSNDATYLGDSYQMSGNARLAFSPWYDNSSGGRGYFHWAVAGMVARPDGNADASVTNNNESRFRTRPEGRSASRWFNTGRIPGARWYEILGLETIFNAGPLQIVGEYQHNWLQRDATAALQSDLQFSGWYVYANYILTGEHIPYTRSSGTIGRLKPFENFFLVDRCRGGVGHGWGAWGVGVRYSSIDLSDDNILGGEGDAWTLALNWYWTAHARLQFNLIYGEIENHRSVSGFTSGNYTIIGTRAALDF